MTDFLDGWENRQNSIIVFAGVFDPVHNGHLSAAKKALHYGNKVVFLPERVPQHKHGATAYKHRLNMLRIATEDNSDFVVLDYPKEHHWVVETFEWLQKQYPGANFVWLVGQDVEGSMSSWPGIEKLKELSVEKIIVMGREHKFSTYLDDLEGVPVIHAHRPLQADYKVSSSRIRESLAKNSGDIPIGVLDYITKNRLYSFVPSST